MAKKQIKFGSNGLNALSTALNTVSEAVEKAETAPATPMQPEQPKVEETPAPTPEQPTYAEPEKSPKKDSVGVNVILPKDIYKRLQMMRIDLDGMPLRSLCLDLIIQGLERYEGKV